MRVLSWLEWEQDYKSLIQLWLYNNQVYGKAKWYLLLDYEISYNFILLEILFDFVRISKDDNWLYLQTGNQCSFSVWKFLIPGSFEEKK